MKLDENQANLFFKLMWCLQFYVNRHLDIYPEIKKAALIGILIRSSTLNKNAGAKL